MRFEGAGPEFGRILPLQDVILVQNGQCFVLGTCIDLWASLLFDAKKRNEGNPEIAVVGCSSAPGKE